MTAVVFNCYYNGLAIIRELGRHDVKVYALDSVRSVGTYSRYARYRHCPDPLIKERAFIDYLLEMGSEFRDKPVLFPTNDHWAMAIAKYKKELSDYYLPCVADYKCVELTIRKQIFYEWAERKNFPVPKCWRYADISNIPDNAFPLAVKPQYRRISSDNSNELRTAKIYDGLRLVTLKSKEELERFVADYKHLLPQLIFQEYVNGLSDSMYTIGIYANVQSEVLGVFTGRKVRGFPPDIGNCIVGQVENTPSELIETVKNICRDIKYQGIGEFEFKRDSITGAFKLIEINPRSWSWVGITPACGVSLPWMAYCDLTGIEKVRYTESNLSDGSVKWVRITADLPNCLYKYRQLGYSQWHMNLRQWVKSLRAEKLVIAELSIDDPIRLYSSLISMAKVIIKHLLGLWAYK